MNILLIAEESAGMHALRSVARSGHRVVAVLTSGRNPLPRGGSLRELAQSLGISVWPITLARDPAFAARVRAEAVDLLINVHALTGVNEQVLSAPGIGAFNMHPGPLPKYDGLNVISWALYNGEPSHAVTVHRISTAAGAGPIAYQTLFPIELGDTALTLSAKCISAGIPLLELLLRDAASGEIPTVVPEGNERVDCGMQVPQHGCISWTRPARDVVNFVRACDYLPFKSPWGHPKARVRDIEFQVVKASRTNDSCAATPPGTVGWLVGRGAAVACQDEWAVVNRVVIDGRTFDAADLLHPGDRAVDGAVAGAIPISVVT
jgi:methionyl-tRNA formyltransferase